MKMFRTLLVIALAAVGITAAPQAAAEEDDAADDRRSAPRLLKSFGHEPDVRAVQRAALAQAGLNRRDAPAWRTRARLANLVPSIEGDVEWDGETDRQLQYSEEFGTREQGGLKRSDADHDFEHNEQHGRSVGVDVELDLGGLVFDRNEIYAARELRKRRSARRELLAHVAKLYFKRRKRQVLVKVAPATAWTKKLELTLAVRRLTARIDGLTGGWFSRQLEDSTPDEEGP